MLLILISAFFLMYSDDSNATSPKRCSSQFFGHVEAIHASPKLFVFISLSMPEASLKELGRQAQKHKAVLVMRGLYQDSFVKTAQRLKELGMTVDIHPDLFEQHQVTVVPTFIQIQDGKPIHRLSGNVTLAFCAEKFGEAS